MYNMYCVVCPQEGGKLVESTHYASEDISDKLSTLDTCWQGLVAASHEKALRLQQAYQVQSH